MNKIIIAIALCVSLSANAEVFKCVDADGKTAYQNTPCPNDTGYFVDLDKNTKMSVDEYKKNKEQEHLKQEFEAAKRIEEQQSNSSSNYYTGPTSSTSRSIPNYSGSRTIHTGPRGGRYYYNSSGNKTYVRRK